MPNTPGVGIVRKVAAAQSTVPVDLPYVATLAPDCDDGLYRKCTVTGALHLDPPVNATEGMRWEGWFLASGGDQALTFDTAIVVPTDSGFVSPKTLTSGKLYIVLLKYNGTAWMLVSLVGGY